MKKNKLTLSPSSAHVWSRCGGSTLLKGIENPLNGREAADRGTLIHKIAERRVTNPKILEKPLDSFERIIYDSDRYNIDRIVGAYIELLAQERAKLQGVVTIEKKLSTATHSFEISGTPDAYLVTKDQIIVYDLKTGFVEIEAEHNEQLMVYAHLIAKSLPKQKTPRTLVGVIVQPELNQVDRAEYAFQPNFFENIQIDQKKFVTGAHCLKCNARPVCKTFEEKTDKFLAPEYRDYTIAREIDWPELLDIAPAAIKFFEGVRSEALQYLKAGGQIPGYGLGMRSNQRSWKDNLYPNDIGRKLGLRPDEIIKSRLETPAAIEKLLKAKGKSLGIFETLVFSSQSQILKKDSGQNSFEKNKTEVQQQKKISAPQKQINKTVENKKGSKKK